MCCRRLDRELDSDEIDGGEGDLEEESSVGRSDPSPSSRKRPSAHLHPLTITLPAQLVRLITQALTRGLYESLARIHDPYTPPLLTADPTPARRPADDGHSSRRPTHGRPRAREADRPAREARRERYDSAFVRWGARSPGKRSVAQSPDLLNSAKLTAAATLLLADLRCNFARISLSPPAGKTYLTEHLTDLLTSPPNSLSVAVFSTDDLYLPHSGLAALASSHPENKMLQGRGLPGSHDLPLGRSLLSKLLSTGGRPTQPGPPTPEELDPTPFSASQAAPLVYLPSFDKSQFGGEGDRAPESSWNPVHGPVDVVILEGWSLGFRPVDERMLVRKYAIARAEASVKGAGLDMGEGEEAEGVPEDEVEMAMEEEERSPAFLQHELETLVEVNTYLADYVENWYGFFEVFIQVRPVCRLIPHLDAAEIVFAVSQIVPPALSSIYKWRTQQEHHRLSPWPTSTPSDALR